MSWDFGGPDGLPPLPDDGQRRDEPAGAGGQPPAGDAFGGTTLQLGDGAPGGGAAGGGAPFAGLNTGDDATMDLPSRLRPRPPRRGVSPWAAALLVLLALAVIIPGALYARLGQTSGRTSEGSVTLPGCDQANSPCSVAQAFLVDYAAGKYEPMYNLVSQASITRFGDPAILRGNYKDAHDYIVNRTAALIGQAGAYAIQATPGSQQLHGANAATVPFHVVMQTIRVGTITQDIALPLVLEKGQWRVSWSPGVVFAHLDDPADPHYQRLLHLFAYDGQRGRILDRNGNVLAQDGNVVVVGVEPDKIKDAATLLKALSNDLGYTAQEIQQLYQGAQDPTRFVPVRTISAQQYNPISADLASLTNDGVQIQQTTGRLYPYGMDAAPVTGYVQGVSDQDILNDPSHYYEPTDMIGRTGIEAWAEQQLRPVKGGELDIVPVNDDGSYGPAVYTVARRAAADGADVHTALDIKLQQKAMAELRAVPVNKETGVQPGGGAVALDPATGEVLALASNPVYDPNDFAPNAFSNGNTIGIARLNSLNHPYLNWATQVAGPVGSVGKVATLAAALESGMPAATMFDCTGVFQIPGQPAVSHDWEVHGNLTLQDGLAQSCDVVFWTVAVALNGKDQNLLPNMVKGFGYGSKTGLVGLPADEEVSGLVPDPQWLQQTHNSGWAPVDAANLAIGQGFFEATPLQIAAAAAAIANNGQRMQPRLVTAVVAPSGQAVASYPAKAVGTLPLSSDHLAVLQASLLGPTTQPDGTVYNVFGHLSVRVAGKTGTAESATDVPNSAFLAYAPAPPASGGGVTPTIALGVLIPNAGHGADVAAPIVRDLILFDLNLTS